MDWINDRIYYSHTLLSEFQQMSFGVYQEGLDDLPQQRGTRESLLPGVVKSCACA